jgi:hypothetical protein
MAHESDKHYGDILQSCTRIVFMGTPHRGADLASWGALLSWLVNTLTLSSAVRTDLLRGLKTRSKTLQIISRQFVQRGIRIHIVSFYERKPTRSLSTLVSCRHVFRQWRTIDPCAGSQIQQVKDTNRLSKLF